MSSQEVSLQEGRSVMTPTGQVIDLANPAEVALAYGDLQQLKTMIREAEGVLKKALLDHSAAIGKKTFEVGTSKVEVKGGTQKVFDALGLKRALKGAGYPDERISEIVRETIEYKVMAVEARQAAAANADYAAVIEACTTIEEKAPTIAVSRIGGGKRGAARAGELTASQDSDPPADALSGPLPWEE